MKRKIDCIGRHKNPVSSLDPLTVLVFTLYIHSYPAERIHMGLGWQLNHLTCELLPMKKKSSLLGRRGSLGPNPWECKTRILVFHLLQGKNPSGRQQQVERPQTSAELIGEGRALSQLWATEIARRTHNLQTWTLSGFWRFYTVWLTFKQCLTG